MALKALKCPSCGADITLDDDREFGFCAYCGTQIQLGDRINVHVTHEYKGNTPHVNVTNNYYYDDDGMPDDDKGTKPHIVIEKPTGKKLGWGIALAIIGIIGLTSSEGKQFSYIAVCLIMLVIAGILLVSYYRAMQIYNEAVRKASSRGTIFPKRYGHKK